MFKGLTRRDFIKTTSLAAVGFMVAGCGGGSDKSAASGGSDKPADLVVYGKIFTSEDNKIVEAFAVRTANSSTSATKRARKRLSTKARLKLSTTPTKGS